ncbi:nucleic-acid-binding protein from transposon X-element [Trichonephila clavipes]|nr:nucleic-acid-binding protein from transposon X-element [Trichonephila clavipes]
MRSHTFEMADNKQLKAVIRGLPTDYYQKEIASELKGFGAPKCLKCSGSHLTADCKKSTKSPAKCANCGGPHPANFSGCPSNPINRKQHKNEPNKNIWTEKAKERTQKSTPRQHKPSYASVTAQNTSTNNTFDANAIMQQMGQMMQQWGTMIAFLQQNNKN